MKRIKEPSTWAGLGLLCQGIAALVSSKGADATAWASIIGGVSAVLMPERGASGA